MRAFPVWPASFSISIVTTTSENTPLSAPIDLRRVRRLFAAPERLADSAFLRREVSVRMRERLELVRIAPQRILDAGCGDGADLAVLQQMYANPRIFGVDAAHAMLAAGRARHQTTRSSIDRLMRRLLPVKLQTASIAAPELLCADFARLPLAADSVDLVWSNLALHWHPQPDRVFAEWRRVLRTDGLLMFSCFGPDTFKELRAAFASVDAAPHCLPFVDMHDFGDMLVDAGFSTPVMDMEKVTVTYPSVEKLIADLRAWGGNPLANRRKGLLSRAAWNHVRQVLEKGVDRDGRIPLGFELIYGHAFRPVPKRTAAGEAIVRFDRPKK
jgi:malonyl-CoA O-methyltransferase